jgi:immunity protein 8 of polymorphic toxin system
MTPVTAKIHWIELFTGEPHKISLEQYQPENPEHFGIDLQLWIRASDPSDSRELGDLIDPEGASWPADGSDDFNLTICTPSWFAERAEEDWRGLAGFRGPRQIPGSIIMGSAMWFVKRWDRSEILAGLAIILDEIGPDWGSVASRISRYLTWDLSYVYDKHVNDHFGEPFPPPRT